MVWSVVCYMGRFGIFCYLTSCYLGYCMLGGKEKTRGSGWDLRRSYGCWFVLIRIESFEHF